MLTPVWPRRGPSSASGDARPAPVEPVRLVRPEALRRLELGFEHVPEAGADLLCLGLLDHAFFGEPLGIDRDDARLLPDPLVHERLREGRLVAFIVAMPPVADHVDHDGLVELLAEFGRHTRAVNDGFRIVAIHVENRRLDHTGNVGRVGRRARETRRRREADLVVDDEVKRAAGAVPLQAGQAEALRYHALAREGRVTVQEKRQNLGPALVVALVLLRAHFAKHDGIDDLKVRRVRRQREMNLIAVELAVAGDAEMVFDVARAFHVVRVRRAALELVKQRAERLAHHIREHVQPAAMRHADDDFLYAELAAALNDLLERGHRQFRTFQAETLRARIFLVEKSLKAFCVDKLRQDRLLAKDGELDLFIRSFDALLNPELLLGRRDVHELKADRSTIGPPQNINDLPQARGLQAEDIVDVNLMVQICRREPDSLLDPVPDASERA